MNLSVKDIRTFISGGDRFDITVKFYQEIGFTLQFKNNDLAGLGLDGCNFFLQRYPNKWMEGNFMMALEVESVDDWWQFLQPLNLEAKYPGVKVKEPMNYPWGKREIHLIDPVGVLWHIACNIPT